MILKTSMVWLAIQQRLDGKTRRYGPEPYIRLVMVDDGMDERRIEAALSIEVAAALARGLSQTVKHAKAMVP